MTSRGRLRLHRGGSLALLLNVTLLSTQPLAGALHVHHDASAVEWHTDGDHDHHAEHCSGCPVFPNGAHAVTPGWAPSSLPAPLVSLERGVSVVAVAFDGRFDATLPRGPPSA